MLTNKKKSFTFVELLMVIAIIGILMLGMTVYLGKSGDRAKSIEAEGCANALGGVLGNYAYYTLTSRNLRIRGENEHTESPTYYYIQLTGGTQDGRRCIPENIGSGIFCKDIILGYATGYVSGDYIPDEHIEEYEDITVSNTCRHGKPHLGFYRSGGSNSGNISFIRMNKGFTPRDVQAEKVFFLNDNLEGGGSEQLLTGEIVVVLCSEEMCNGRKQIGKRQVDARSQTIDFKKCRYYFEGSNICKTREDCRVYSGSDPTVCMEY